MTRYISTTTLFLLCAIFLCYSTVKVTAKWINLAGVNQTATSSSPTYMLSILYQNASFPSKTMQAPQGFVGFSLEWEFVNSSLGNSANLDANLNPVTMNLYNQLHPSAKYIKGKGTALLRIGGNSATKMGMDLDFKIASIYDCDSSEPHWQPGWGPSKYPEPQPFGQPLGVTIW